MAPTPLRAHHRISLRFAFSWRLTYPLLHLPRLKIGTYTWEDYYAGVEDGEAGCASGAAVER